MSQHRQQEDAFHGHIHRRNILNVTVDVGEFQKKTCTEQKDIITDTHGQGFGATHMK